MMDKGLYVVIVFYNPSEEDISHARMISGRYHGVVVDNSDHPSCDEGMLAGLKYIANNKNLGIAEAQNIGIAEALKHDDTRFVVFLDQDSRLDIDYPEKIAGEFETIRETHGRLALLGPTIINKDTNEAYSSVFHPDSGEERFCKRREIISSGSCMSREAIEKVGVNDARLFIDYVDFDWCWRANAMGYECGTTKALSIDHKVGRGELHFGKISVSISAPFRYYYQYRNYQWLLRRSYVPGDWKLRMGIKQALRFCYFPFLVKDGCKCWKQMAKGIWHGITKLGVQS